MMATATTAAAILLIAATMVTSSSSSSPSAVAEYRRPSRGGDVAAAMGEMQKANYFAFVMLINMAPPDLFQQGNVTLLMPNDRALSRPGIMPDSDVVTFLLRHSIPSGLLFDHLRHFPTGSFIPSSKPDAMLRVTNYGRRQFFLNNSRIVNPNVCTTATSITCHGIDGVLAPGDEPGNTAPPPPPPRAPRAAALPSAAPSEPASPPPIMDKDNNNNTPPPSSSLTPPPADSIKMNSAQRLGCPSIIVGIMWFVLFMFPVFQHCIV